MDNPRVLKAGDVVRASIPAALGLILLSALLRLTHLSPGLRTGIAFFGFLVLQNVFLTRIAQRRLNWLKWTGVLAIALASSAALAFIVFSAGE